MLSVVHCDVVALQHDAIVKTSQALYSLYCSPVQNCLPDDAGKRTVLHFFLSFPTHTPLSFNV